MWTPRRLILIVAGMFLFSGGFTLYSKLFGWIDGLPPLPDPFTLEQTEVREIPELPTGVGPLQTRLRVAFGMNCIEQTYNLKFESREKGLLFAAADTKILDDGRVLLHQVSVAIFGKNNKEEMSTIHADRALLTYDEPVRKIDDIGTRKVKAAELIADSDAPTNDPRRGKIHITNNRKTLDPEDDVIMLTAGPLHYMDEPKPAQPHIWTKAVVEITDRHMRPLPTQPEYNLRLPTVTGEGMRVFLATGTPTKNTANAPKTSGNSSVNGVDRIDFERNVFMNLWTQSGNMLGSNPNNAPAPKKADGKPAEKVLVTVQTNGPFHYDMIKDIAHFEVPPQTDPNLQEYVKVVRHAKGSLEDTLTSDFLDVQFKRKKDEAGAKGAASPPPKPKAGSDEKSASSDENMEVETMHAWGKNIALSSDEESLFAYGFDLFYDARIKQTILKGAPMHAVKEGRLIRAPELLLANLDDKEKHHVRARGPGIVGMGEFDPKTQEHSQQAHWQDWLIVVSVKEQGKLLDLITLTGQAKFIDTLNNQQLDGRQLRVWMLPSDGTAGKKEGAKVVAKNGAKPAPKEDNKKLPHRLEAVGDVRLQSPDLLIHRSEYLNVWFKDLPPAPAPSPPPEGKDSPGPLPMRIDAVPPGPKAADPTAAKKEEPAKKDAPIIIRHAQRIQAWVNRVDGKNDLDKVHNEGNVVIHQDPSPGNEKGVDIAGHTVDLEHFAEGNYLVVEGNEQVLGEVHFDKISIVADDIKIDQRDNTAAVKGPGSMRMLSKTSLDGAELKTPTYIDVFWNEGMELDGPIRSVRYEGTVQAKQEERKVLCETMQVWLDRPVFLNQASKPKKTAKKGEDDSPKVEKVLCDQQPGNGMKLKQLKQVAADEIERIGGQVVKFQNVLGTQIEMDNVQNKMTAAGPGTVRLWQAGARDPLADEPADPKIGKAKGKEAKDEVMKLTWVKFDQRMIAYNAMPKRAVFYNICEMVHMPSPRPDTEIDITKLPEGSLYLKCHEMLEITTLSRKTRDRDGKEVEIKWQEMKAKGNVRIMSDDYDGWAGTVTFSEEKSLLVFTGTRNNDGTLNPAVLNRAEVKGGERKTFRGERIIYNTKTKDFSIDGGVGGTSN